MRQRDTSEFVAQGLRRLGYTSSNLKGGMKAWGEHYAVRALVEDPDLAIYQVSRPARGCLSYIVASAGKAIVIDPLRHLHPCLDLARGASLTIEAVIDTTATRTTLAAELLSPPTPVLPTTCIRATPSI